MAMDTTRQIIGCGQLSDFFPPLVLGIHPNDITRIVVAKLTRKGDEILYEVTIEDPRCSRRAMGDGSANATLNRAPDAGLLRSWSRLRYHMIIPT